MRYEFVAIPDDDVPIASDPAFQHVVATYASETNKTASMWRAVPDGLLDFRPHDKVNTIRAILVHQILSERRFFAQFVGTKEPPVDRLLPPGDHPAALEYVDRYVAPRARLPHSPGRLRSGGWRNGRSSAAWSDSESRSLAARSPHLPPPDPGPGMAPDGRRVPGPAHLRALGRRALG